MTAETPGCGSNSEARKRLEQAADPHAGCTPGTCRQTEQWRSVSCTDQPIAVEVPRDVTAETRAAEVLCAADDTMHHHDRTDDFPCSTCVARAAALSAADCLRDDPSAPAEREALIIGVARGFHDFTGGHPDYPLYDEVSCGGSPEYHCEAGHEHGSRGICWACEPPSAHIVDAVILPLLAARDDREGETVTEWGVLFTNGNVFQCGSEEGAVSLALNPDDRAVARQRTRFRDVVTDWSPVTPDGGDRLANQVHELRIADPEAGERA